MIHSISKVKKKSLLIFSYNVVVQSDKLDHIFPHPNGKATCLGRTDGLSFLPWVKPGLHVRRKHKHKHKHKHKKPTCKPVRRKHKRLVLALVFMLASSRFTCTTQRRKHKHKHIREWNDFDSLVLMLMLMRRSCKPR